MGQEEMQAKRILKQAAFPLLLMAVLLATLGGCAAPAEVPPAEVPPAEEEGEIKRVVEVKAEGLTLHYLRQSFWGEERFSNYSANQAQFKADFKEQFEQELAVSHASASGYSFSFDSATQSTLIRCDIHDAISKSGNRYTARFEWLELPKGFDLLNFDKISDDELKGETEINGIPVTLTLSFPAPIGNCHWHAWWTD